MDALIGRMMSGNSAVCDTVVAEIVRSKNRVLFAAVPVADPLFSQTRITVATFVPKARTRTRSTLDPLVALAVKPEL